jgi:hypothetical protein
MYEGPKAKDLNQFHIQSVETALHVVFGMRTHWKLGQI